MQVAEIMDSTGAGKTVAQLMVGEMEEANAEFKGGRTTLPLIRMFKAFMISLPKRGVSFLTT